jgi:predicted metal-dependent enzyme (double-stranded beta helix superfamily)
MFDLQGFIDSCRRVVSEPHGARLVLDLMREALKDPQALKAAITPLEGKVGALDAPLYRDDQMVVLNVALRPGFLTIPHDHRIWAVIGIYEGQENNTFYRRAGPGLEQANQRDVAAGEAMLLGADVIHAIENPLTVPTLGLHVYGGDLLAATRSMWNPHTGEETPYDVPTFYQWSKERARMAPAA